MSTKQPVEQPTLRSEASRIDDERLPLTTEKPLASVTSPIWPVAGAPLPAQMPHLQRTIGNRAVGRLLQHKGVMVQRDQASAVRPTPTATIQPKLTIGHPHDPHEQEAEAVADQVMQRTAGEARTALPSIPGALSPTTDTDAEELQRQEEEEEGGEVSQISRQALGDGRNEAPAGLESKLNQARGLGAPLPQPVRLFMEQAIGADFRGVKIHDDSAAIAMSTDLQADAFTYGSDIYFNRNQYNPTSTAGKRLLAHELTHVVQQNHGLQRRFIQRRAVEEAQKYTVIDYKKAKADNLRSWYDQYKFLNLFKELEIYPGSTPIAYANHVYELQMKVEESTGGQWTAPEAGILEPVITADATFTKVLAAASKHHADPTVTYGFDPRMLERLYTYMTSFEEKASPLVSTYFSGVRQLELVNRNPSFFIQFDDRGDYVKRLQAALLALNYNLGSDLKLNRATKAKEVSGSFGQGTKQAVINFQKDAGFEGKAVDGIVGQVTLRLLDQRLGAPLFKPSTGGAGNAYGFHVPVAAADLLLDQEILKVDLLKRTLKVAFPVNEEQIDILLRSGWHWTHYKAVTQSDVDLGYTEVTITKADYQSVVGKIDQSVGGQTGEPVQETLERQTLDLLKTGKLYELNQKIRDLEALIRRKRLAGDPEMHGRDIDWEEIRKDEATLAALQQERQAELNRLGLTLDDYEKLQTDFIRVFEKFAVLTAFRLLSENEMQINIEAQHYTKIEEVTAIKAILADLAAKYQESEKLWWAAVSLEDTRGRDSGYYKSADEYSSKNIYVAGESVVDTSDPTRYYSETNVANMYKAQEKQPSPYFTPWQEKEKAVVTTLQGAVKKFPILAYPKLELRRNATKEAAKSNDALQKMLLGIIRGADDEKGIKQNIDATRQELAQNPGKIWELPIVVLRAQYALGVIDGVPVELIKAKQKAVADKGFWESIGLAILGVGLGLLALVSGPVGWLALAASIGVGAYDAYRTYNEITFKQETANTALDPASALGTEDPSYFWFWVSLVSVGLDVLQAAKLVKSVAKGIDLAEGVTKGLREAKAAAEVRLLEAGGETTAKGKAILKEIEEIDAALSKVSSTTFAENIKFLEPLKANPLAVVVMSEALKDKKIVQAVTALGKMVEKELFDNALKFYASVGRKSLDELPELMRLIKEGGLDAHKPLVAELLADPRAQRVLLDTQDPAFLLTHFHTWEAAVKAGEAKSFVKYLEAEKLTTKLAHDTKLVDMFGEAFATLPNTVKNRQILRTIEPRLLDAFNAGALSPEIRKALDVLLNSELLAQSTRLASAQERALHELRLLGSVIETQSDFAKVVALLDTPAARRALWEGASQLAGKDKYIEIILKANGGKLPPPDVLDDLIRIGPMTDEGTIQSLLTPAGQKLRQALAVNPEAVAVLKKCASPCLPPFVTPAQVDQVARIMKGKSSNDVARIRELLYANRASENSFQTALTNLETNFADALKDVAIPVLTKPPGLAVTDETLHAIRDLGLPVSEVNKIMNKAARVHGGSAILTDLLRVLQFEKNVSLKHFDTLIKGLAEGTTAEFRAARHLLDEAERFANATAGFTYSGLQKADSLLGRFSLTELNTLMGARWSEGFVNSLYDVVTKLPGLKNSELIDLIAKAGGGSGPGNLGRLREILATMKAPTVTYDEALKAIQAADAFAADVAKAMKDPATGYHAMAKLIWGETVTVEGDVIKVTDILGKSGSDAYQTVYQLGKGEALAKTIAAGGVLSKDKWVVFRKVIQDADIALPIKNSIIGEMWTRVNVQVYKGQGFTVYREVSMTTGKVTAKADIVLEKGGEIVVVECKSGGAVYTTGQEVVYPLLQEGKFRNIMLTGDEALAKKFADPNTKLRFVIAREADMIK